MTPSSEHTALVTTALEQIKGDGLTATQLRIAFITGLPHELVEAALRVLEQEGRVRVNWYDPARFDSKMTTVEVLRWI